MHRMPDDSNPAANSPLPGRGPNRGAICWPGLVLLAGALSCGALWWGVSLFLACTAPEAPLGDSVLRHETPLFAPPVHLAPGEAATLRGLAWAALALGISGAAVGLRRSQ